MIFLPNDLWLSILASLPLKCITTSKLVCKQWKSLIESEIFRGVFLSQQKILSSSSSWSLMWRERKLEFMAHYGHDIPKSLSSYISSFLANFSKTQKERHKKFPPRNKIKTVKVVAYTNVGLILICLKSFSSNRIYYVANPISQQTVKILPPPSPLPPRFQREQSFRPAGLATRIENGLVLGYKVVCLDTSNVYNCVLSFMIYSSETISWSFKKVHSPIPLFGFNHRNPVSLNGKIYWTAPDEDDKDDLVGHDFYGNSDQYNVIRFPEVKSEQVGLFKRAYTISEGSLMYMNIISEELLEELREENRLCVWKLKNNTAESEDWELVASVLIPYSKEGCDYIPLTIHPFDAKTIYLWSREHHSLVSINLENKKFVKKHKDLEHRNDGVTIKSVSYSGYEFPDPTDGINEAYLSTFVLTPWLQRIP